ncbi:peroxidase 27-like [Juglans microcarpa x Juglans regia]|uniref:peroxidase 27-like n=1 Tax=Juglans microcarpa x Juglans regia TaxID=2249226 RepID=UPI001B7F0D43|nr:peroxidase 27-like [Juglans microcarpa x Juglans regia]
MATRKLFLVLFLQLIMFVVLNPVYGQERLKLGFYEKSCPEAEAIVKKVMVETLSKAPTLAAPLIRMHFHDCFVRGCDGSVLLSSSTNQAEKDFASNLNLRGFQIIDRVKSALEKACPGVVSCADILALVARDATATIKGPSWEVETGRKDGRVSSEIEAHENLVPPTANITQLIRSFQERGLSIKDLVVLSGAHTVGTSHCYSFNYRLYNFTGKGDTDPNLDPNYIKRLKNKCKPGDNTTLVEMNPGSFKMGRIGVLTGKAGEIRKQCSKVNK